MMGFLTWIGSSAFGAILNPILSFAKSILGTVEDTKLEMYRVDGQVDIALIQANVAIIQARAELLKNKWLVGLQVFFGLPTAAFYAKCLVWDKMLKMGSTDPLTGDTATWAMMIVSFLFLHSAITTWNRKT